MTITFFSDLVEKYVFELREKTGSEMVIRQPYSYTNKETVLCDRIKILAEENNGLAQLFRGNE